VSGCGRPLILLAVVLVAGCGADPAPPAVTPTEAATEAGSARHFAVEPVADGLNRPTWVGTAPGDADTLWVLEQPGRVVRIAGGDERTVLLDLAGDIAVGAEQGLLGAAFHPDFATNDLVYLHWSDPMGDTRVAEFRLAGDELRETRELLSVDQPEENHNGGQLAFGPDGRLYLGLGDGGGAFDPGHNAQDDSTLLGKIVATPVTGEPDWQVVLKGLRNPWRFAFDAALGELWIGDVGQDNFEEVNRVMLEPDEPPKNLGWHAYEGTVRLPNTHDVKGDGELVWPVAQYSHRDGGHCSITGGVVYGGAAIPALARRYVYGDFCSGTLWSLVGPSEGGARDVRREAAKVPQLTHIGTDAEGELLFASGAGTIYAAVAAGSP
jgi:glucose/arabinose dehydrogenase